MASPYAVPDDANAHDDVATPSRSPRNRRTRGSRRGRGRCVSPGTDRKEAAAPTPSGELVELCTRMAENGSEVADSLFGFAAHVAPVVRQVVWTGADPTRPRFAAMETGLRSVTDVIERVGAYPSGPC